MNKEILEKAKAAKSPEEIIDIARSAGANMKADVAEDIFKSLCKSGELSDDELDQAVGGCGASNQAQPETNTIDERSLSVTCPYCGYSSTFGNFVDRGSDWFYGQPRRYAMCPSCYYVSNVYEQLEEQKKQLQ